MDCSQRLWGKGRIEKRWWPEAAGPAGQEDAAKNLPNKREAGGEWRQLGVRFPSRRTEFVKRSERVSFTKEQECFLPLKRVEDEKS